MTYVVNLCFRAKGEHDYEHIGRVDIGEPLTHATERIIRLPKRRKVRVRIDHNHLIPVHMAGVESVPVIYVTEV